MIEENYLDHQILVEMLVQIEIELDQHYQFCKGEEFEAEIDYIEAFFETQESEETDKEDYVEAGFERGVLEVKVKGEEIVDRVAENQKQIQEDTEFHLGCGIYDNVILCNIISISELIVYSYDSININIRLQFQFINMESVRQGDFNRHQQTYKKQKQGMEKYQRDIFGLTSEHDFCSFEYLFMIFVSVLFLSLIVVFSVTKIFEIEQTLYDVHRSSRVLKDYNKMGIIDLQDQKQSMFMPVMEIKILNIKKIQHFGVFQRIQTEQGDQQS